MNVNAYSPTAMGGINLIKFIEVYRNSPCLWNFKADCFWDRNLQMDALRRLLAIYQRYDRAANLNAVRLVIDNMRIEYEREIQIIKRNNGDTINPGDICQSPIWYVNRLDFLYGTQDIRLYDPNHQDEEYQVPQEEDGWPAAEYMMDDEPYPPPKRMRGEITPVEDRLLTLTERLLTPRGNTDELHAFGCTLGASLKTLEPTQQVFAQRIMSEVVYLGKLNKLGEKVSLIQPESTQTTALRSDIPGTFRVSSVIEGNLLEQPAGSSNAIEGNAANEQQGNMANSDGNGQPKTFSAMLKNPGFAQDMRKANDKYSQEAFDRLKKYTNEFLIKNHAIPNNENNNCAHSSNQGINYANPNNQGINYANPNDQAINYSNSNNQGINYSNPNNQGYNYTNQNEQGIDYSNPNYQSNNYANPKDQGINYANPNGQSMNYANPNGQSINYANPNYQGYGCANPNDQSNNYANPNQNGNPIHDDGLQIHPSDIPIPLPPPPRKSYANPYYAYPMPSTSYN